MMARYLSPAGLVMVLLLSGAGFPQAPDQKPSFLSQTNLVLVPVQVRSHNEHVAGLKQDSFTLLQDGSPGEYLVRIVVRDNLTGRTGATNSFLKVE